MLTEVCKGHQQWPEHRERVHIFVHAAHLYELALWRSSMFCYEWTDEEMCTVVVRWEVGKALRRSSHQILLTRIPIFLDHMQGSNKWSQSLATLRMFSDGWEQCNGIKPSRNHCTDALLSARSFSISPPRVINRYVSGRSFVLEIRMRNPTEALLESDASWHISGAELLDLENLLYESIWV